MITIVKLINHILKTLPKTTSQFEVIIQDHKLMTIYKNHLKEINEKNFLGLFFQSHS